MPVSRKATASRRPRALPTSKWLAAVLDNIAKRNHVELEQMAFEYGRDADWEALVRKHPTETDVELAKRGVEARDFSWSRFLDKEEKRIIAWINDLVKSATHNQAGADDPEFWRFDADENSFKVHFDVWGESYTYDPENEFMTRTELPDSNDMYDDAIEKKLKANGATKVRTSWRFEDADWGPADTVVVAVDATWEFDAKALFQKYGEKAFVRGALKALPEARAEVAATPAVAPRTSVRKKR